jgi:hypothetical protein
MNGLDFNPVNLNSLDDLKKLLDCYQINTDIWTESGSSVSSLYDEVKAGDCTLEIKDGKLHSRVNGAVIKCTYTDNEGNRYQIFEEKQVFQTGKIRNRGHRFISEKIRFCETPEEGALRGLAEELQISGPEIRLIPQFDENKCDTIDSPYYKGIQATYNSYVFSCEIPHSHYRERYVEKQEDKTTHFSWVKI